MSLVKDIIKIDIINHEHLLERIIKDWNNRYKNKLEKLSAKFGIKSQLLSMSDSDSDKECITNNDIACKLIKQAIKCKAYAETEYKSIKDIRSELEDCQMIKELGVTLRKLEEEKSEQNIKLKALNGKNLELQQEKQNLEKSLLQLSLQSKLANGTVSDKTVDGDYNEWKSALTAKLETFTNRTQGPKRTNKNPEYCHIAPIINLFSDSELSISEEDSLEKDKHQNNHVSTNSVQNTDYLASPDKFSSGIRTVSKSTPIKNSAQNQAISTSYYPLSNAVSNLTQDLKEIQKYFDKRDDEPAMNTIGTMLDWEMSQISFDDLKEHANSNAMILEAKEDPDDDQPFINNKEESEQITSNIAHSSQTIFNNPDYEMEQLQSELKLEKEKYISLSNRICELYALTCERSKLNPKDMLTCYGDSPTTDMLSQDPLELVRIITLAMDSKNSNDKKSASKSFRSRLMNKLMNKNSKKIKKIGEDDIASPITSPEMSVINKLVQIQSTTKPLSDSRIQIKNNHELNSSKRNSKNHSALEISHLTRVMENKEQSEDIRNTDPISIISKTNNKIENNYDSEDFNSNIFKSLSETSVRLLAEMVSNISNISQLLSENPTEFRENGMKDFTPMVTEYLQFLMSLDSVDFNNENCKHHPIFGLLTNLEMNVQKMISNRKNEDRVANDFSQSLENFYQEQLNKCYGDINRLKQQLESTQQLFTSKLPIDATEAIFEAKQQLQAELESVDREYARQMARERKRLEESEIMYNELLTEHEEMQSKYNEKVIALNQQMEQLERKIEADRKFIDQQQFEWELERSQHNMDIENLNKSISKVKRSSSCSDNLSDGSESILKEVFQKSNSLPKYKNKSSLDSSEVSYTEIATQTNYEDIIIFKTRILFSDLDKYDEFLDLRENIYENQNSILNVVNLLSDIMFEIAEVNQSQVSLNCLREFNSKDNFEIFNMNDSEYVDIREEILKVHENLKQFLDDKVNLKANFDKLQEELEASVINMTIKQEMVKTLEEEIQSLIEFQRNLSKDYDLLQSMLEEKQNELDALSEKLLSHEAKKDLEEVIRNLTKELNDKQNIIDERDEDLYVLKEEKELIEQDLLQLKEKYEMDISQQNDIYQDLEKEMNEQQNLNKELQHQIENLSKNYDNKSEQMVVLNRSQESLTNKISKLIKENDILNQKNLSLIDDGKLAELRLSEMRDQHKLEISKINISLEDIEHMNRKLLDENKANKVLMSTSFCQTESTECDSGSRDSLISFVNIQNKFIKIIDQLRAKYHHERDLRNLVETKYRHLSSQYEMLSNKVFLLGNRVNETKSNNDKDDSGDVNRSVESIDLNDLLNESQISVDEDIELNKLLQECCGIKSNDGYRAIATQTESSDPIPELKNINIFSDSGLCNFSDWLPDLLKEVEIVLQSCIFGEDIPRDMIPKMNRFRNLLEQMYKNQLTILLNKLSGLDSEIQLQRKTNLELKHKSEFILTELQEKEAVQRNLRNRLDQELSNNTRLVESNRNLSDQIRLIKNDLTNQTSYLKDELDREKNKYMDLTRQMRNDQHCREQLEAALSVSDERIKLVEQSNVELIKKSRQQADYYQKEIDTFNSEYAEVFRRSNNYKIQIETLQQNLQYQTMECEKTKGELQETIKSNTEYRDKMNEFVKIYQERRRKLETEINELHQILQISCRREITFVKENETLRIKCQTIKSICKDYEKNIKELEKFVSDLHLKHEEDRQDWLHIFNGNIDSKDKDEGVLSQVNWLLKMLQLRIELLMIHYNPNGTTSTEADNAKTWGIDPLQRNMFKCRPFSADTPLSQSSSELMMLLQSIKSMQTMINMYLNRNQTSASQNTEQNKCTYSARPEKQILSQNHLLNRPKPTGSSDSLNSLSESDSVSEPPLGSCNQSVDSLSTKIYVIQTNKIVELQMSLETCEKRRQQLIEQKSYILSQLSNELRNFITTPLLTEHQQLLIRSHFFKFKFRAVVIAVMAHKRFSRSFHLTRLEAALDTRPLKTPSQLPQPRFSTSISTSVQSNPPAVVTTTTSKTIPTRIASNVSTSNSVNVSRNIPKKISNGSPNCIPRPRVHDTNSTNKKVSYVIKYTEPRYVESKSKTMKVPNTETILESLDSDIENSNRSNQVAKKLATPVSSTSPTFDRHGRSRPAVISHSATFPRSVNKNPSNSRMSPLSNSYSHFLRKSLPVSSSRDPISNSSERNTSDKSRNFSTTLKQIDDFGKRLDKYSDISNDV